MDKQARGNALADKPPITLLHIDDDSDHLKFTKLFLEKLSDVIQVTSVSDPKNALDVIRAQSFSCIICDYKMPLLTGVELASLVKQVTDVPFIIYTGQGSEEVAQAAFAAGVDDYVRKETDPSHYQVLLKRIVSAVDKHRGEAETRHTHAVIESFMDSATDGFCILDSELNYIDINKVILERRGLAREEIVGRNIVEVYPLVKESGRFNDYLRVIQTGELFYTEMYDSNNTQRYYQLKAFKVGDGLGIISTDVTRLKRFESRLNALHMSSSRLIKAESLDEIAFIASQILYEDLGFEWGDIGFVEEDEFVFNRGVNFEFPERLIIPLNSRSIIVRSINSGETQLVSDIREDPDYIMLKVPGYDPPNTLSEISVPIKLDDASVGAISIESPKLGAFDEDDRKLLEVLAQHMSAAVRRLREMEDSRRYLEQLEALHQHVLSLNKAKTLDKLLESTYHALEKVMGFEVIDVIKVQSGYLVDHIAKKPSSPPYRLPLDGKGITTRAARQKKPQYVPDIRLDPEYTAINNVTLSEYACPVVVEGETVVVLNVEKPELDAITVYERKLIETLASHLSSAIHRIRQLEALNRSEELYRVLVENTSDPVFVTDDEKYLYLNQRAADLLGYEDPKELIGTKAFAHIADVDRERVREYAKIRLKGGAAPVRYTFTIKRKDGSEVIIENSVSRIMFDGKPASLAINRDITSRVKYEETLTALHDYATRLGAVKTVQEAATTTLDIMEQVFGWGFISFLVLQGRNLVNVEARGGKPGDEPLPLSGPGLTVRAARNGRPVYVPDVSQDPGYIMVDSETKSELVVPVVSLGRVFAILNVESRQLNAFTPQDAELLEILATHVSNSLTRLEHEAELSKASEEKLSGVLRGFEKVSRMVRHDLRNPLQNIRNASKMIEVDPESTEEMLKLIDKNVDYMVYIVDDLGDLVSPRTLHTGLFSLDNLIRGALEKRILPKYVRLKLSLKSGAKLEMDPHKMTRMIDNLVNNALEAMPEGGTLKLGSAVEDGEAVVTITDTGRGIHGGNMGKLFQPFFSTKETGMGLGLTYCKEVVEAHGGSIHVWSKVDKGTTVTLRLPMGTS
ncbi:MAG TPA: GAF domain-containing protein [Candidatus Desulfaltia sp.]|nr:GAF domain-containing protein [Candidatus Desulfaltia sp.]